MARSLKKGPFADESLLKKVDAMNASGDKSVIKTFARRDDGDDIACFEIGKGNKVQIVHDFASAGYEQRKEYDCFWDWFKDAVEEMIKEDESNG